MIPFGDSKRQYAALKSEIDQSVKEVLESGWFILGERLKRFESEFASFCGVKHAVGVGNGTDAIQLALAAAGVGPGDEVITAANSATFTASAISSLNAVPVFADVREENYTIDPLSVSKLINSRTKAIVPVHLYGQCADMDGICKIAADHGLKIIEDACQAHGAEFKGKKSGSIGFAGCFSFYPSKNLGCFGDGGMIITNDGLAADRMMMLRNGGQEKRYYHKIKGYNSRLDEIQAAILSVKLRHLAGQNDRRRAIAALYDRMITNPAVIKPSENNDRRHVYHLYVIRSKRRAELQAHLESLGVQTLIHYPKPIHLQEAYSDLGQKKGSCPVAEKLADEIVSLPIYPELADEEAVKIAEAVNSFRD